MEKWKFVDELLRPLCKAIDDDIAFLSPVNGKNNDDVVAVNIGYKNDRIVKVNVECDSLSAIVKDVLDKIS